MMENKTYWLPTIPMTLVDAINRRAAATGSMLYAMQTAHADYNGHYVTVGYNDYRKYWITEYHWGERVVLRRGSARECLLAAKDYYQKGHKGSTVMFHANTATAEDIAYAESLGFVPHTKEAERAAVYPDERYALINEAFAYERQFGVPAIGILANAASAADYRAKVEVQLQQRRQ